MDKDELAKLVEKEIKLYEWFTRILNDSEIKKLETLLELNRKIDRESDM